jgi:hypothetical protein
VIHIDGRPYSTVRCLICKVVFRLHPDVTVPTLPLCAKHRKRKLSVEQKTLDMFEGFDQVNEIMAQSDPKTKT